MPAGNEMLTAIIGIECSSESHISIPDGAATVLTVIASAVAGIETLIRSAKKCGTKLHGHYLSRA